MIKILKGKNLNLFSFFFFFEKCPCSFTFQYKLFERAAVSSLARMPRALNIGLGEQNIAKLCSAESSPSFKLHTVLPGKKRL